MEVSKCLLLGCVDSANLASGIRGERSGERKRWGWRLHNEPSLELEFEGLCVCISIYVYRVCVCVCVPVHARVRVCVCLCVHVPVCTRVHTLGCACVSVCAHTCVFGGSASCCLAAQLLTPSHTIRGIPAIPATDSSGKTVPSGRDGNVSFYGSVSCCCLRTCQHVQVQSCPLVSSD